MTHGLRLYFDPKTITAFRAHPLEVNNPAAIDCTGMDDSTFEGLFVCWLQPPTRSALHQDAARHRPT